MASKTELNQSIQSAHKLHPLQGETRRHSIAFQDIGGWTSRLHPREQCADPLTRTHPKAAIISSSKRKLVDLLENGAGRNSLFDQLQIVFESKLQATCARTREIHKGWNEGQKCHRKNRTMVVPRVLVGCLVGCGPDEFHRDCWCWDSILTWADENSLRFSAVSEDSCLSLRQEAVHLDCLMCNKYNFYKVSLLALQPSSVGNLCRVRLLIQVKTRKCELLECKSSFISLRCDDSQICPLPKGLTIKHICLALGTLVRHRDS